MTDSPTSQAMHLAMTELKERAERVAVLEDVLRRLLPLAELMLDVAESVGVACHLPGAPEIISDARSVLNKETNRV